MCPDEDRKGHEFPSFGAGVFILVQHLNLQLCFSGTAVTEQTHPNDKFQSERQSYAAGGPFLGEEEDGEGWGGAFVTLPVSTYFYLAFSQKARGVAAGSLYDSKLGRGNQPRAFGGEGEVDRPVGT